ncbi:hypothetical protein Tco_0266931 [Tanacetum coccineum]
MSDGGSPRIIIYGYDGLPMQPVAPPSPDYIPGPEEPQAPLPPDFVPEPVYPEFLVSSDAEASIEEQPDAADASPKTLSPGYVADSNPEEDPKEDPEEDPEEKHNDYPADGGDDDDDEDDDDDDDNDDDADDEDEETSDDEEEEEHLDPADPSVIPVVDPIPSARDTKAFEAEARKTVRLEPPMSPSIEARIAEYAALPTPPLPPPSPLLPCLTYVEAPVGYRAVGIRMGASSPPVPASLPLPSSPLPPLPPSLFLPPVDRMEDILEDELPPRKRLCSTTPTSRYERAEAVGYGIKDTWVDPREAAKEVAPATLEGVNTRVTELATVQEQDTQDIYAVIEDTHDRQTQIFQSVEALVDDRQYHYETARLLDQEALVSREAWAHSVGLSLAVHNEIRGYKTYTWMQDHRIDAQESLIATLNNIPPKKTSTAVRTATRTVVADAAVALMIAAAIEQLITERVSVALANH